MTGNLITTTNKNAAHALAYQGILAYTQFTQIRDMVRGKFGEEYALLFAEPVENQANGDIDWYSHVPGPAQKLEDAPAETRERACGRAASMAGDIQNYADELIALHEPLKSVRGHILKLALCYPDKNCLYLAGEQPVFVCWGFGPGTPGVEPQNLARLAAPVAASAVAQDADAEEKTVPAAPIAATAKNRPPVAWLWWLLPLAALILLLLALFTSFGAVPPLAGKTLFHFPYWPQSGDNKDDTSEIAALETEIAALRSQLEARALMCVEPPAPAPVAEPRQELRLPQKAEDLTFLEGEWLCDTGLANTRTREPVEFAFSFKQNGSGTGTVVEKDDICSGEASAKIENGRLLIVLGPQPCRHSNTSYTPITIICENAAGASTICKGANQDGTSWNATFKKIR